MVRTTEQQSQIDTTRAQLSALYNAEPPFGTHALIRGLLNVAAIEASIPLTVEESSRFVGWLAALLDRWLEYRVDKQIAVALDEYAAEHGHGSYGPL